MNKYITKLMTYKKDTPEARFFEALFATIINIIVYVLFINYYDDIKLFNEDFEDIVPILKFSMIVAIALNASRLIIQSYRYKSFTNIVNNIIFFYIAYKAYSIFPFDTDVLGNEDFWEKVIRVVIIISVAVVFLATGAEFFKIIENKKRDN